MHGQTLKKLKQVNEAIMTFLNGKLHKGFLKDHRGPLFGGIYDENSLSRNFLTAVLIAIHSVRNSHIDLWDFKKIQPCGSSLLSYTILQIATY